jgi:hypothetical protein
MNFARFISAVLLLLAAAATQLPIPRSESLPVVAILGVGGLICGAVCDVGGAILKRIGREP